MRQWAFWLRAAWAVVCTTLLLAIVYLAFRDLRIILWLEKHPAVATVLAGVIQAAVLAGSIGFTFWLTRWSQNKEHEHERLVAQETRFEIQAKAAVLLKLASMRIQAVSDALDIDRRVNENTLQHMRRTIDNQVSALNRFHFEELKHPSDLKNFDAGYGHVIRALDTLDMYIRDSSHSESGGPLINTDTKHTRMQLKEELRGLATRISSFADAIMSNTSK